MKKKNLFNELLGGRTPSKFMKALRRERNFLIFKQAAKLALLKFHHPELFIQPPSQAEAVE